MSNDEQLIRDLIERWAAAVHAGALATVIAHHTDDVVMFDGSWVITHEHHSFPHDSQGDGTSGEEDILELHARWFKASAERDLDATMAVISPRITSYEHSAPLQFTDVEAIREECRTGFELARGEFDWSVPDLQIIVRGDIAVAWGLNRMADTVNGVESVTWSRGTRVFQRTDGEWLMIHQHVSFPYDPATGKAVTELTP